MKQKYLTGLALDDVFIPTSEKYYDKLHNKIMAAIEDVEMELPEQPASRALGKTTRNLREQWSVGLENKEG
jgi:hypothetical protein